MNLIMEVIDGVMPVITITAIEEAQGNKPVSIPTVIGFSIFKES